MTEKPLRHPGVKFPPPILLVGGFAIGWLIHRFVPVGVLPSGADALRVVLGWLAIVGGLGIMLSGLVTFWRARTAVIPHYPATRLVTHGPYRFTRNPMYTGMIAAYLGGVLLVNSAWPLLLLPLSILALVRLVIEREERYLGAAFGDEYARYRARVRRFL